MALRKRKPTSPGRRFQTVSDFAEITKDRARAVAARPEARHRRSQQLRPQDRPPPGRRPQAALPRRRLPAEQGRRRRPRSPRSSTTRTAPAASCCSTTSTARRRYILAPKGVQVGDQPAVGPGLRDPPRQRPAAALHPRRHHRAQRRAAPGGGGKMARSAGSSVQLVAKEGDFATLRLPSTEMRRVPDRLPRHDRRGRQLRGRAHQDRQGRPQPLEGREAADPRRRHEPGRPPPRWRRGQDLRWPPPGVAVGQARGPHPRQDQADPRSSSFAAAGPAAAGGRTPCRAA